MSLNLKIKEGSENYAATIVEIDNIHPIKDADLIVRTVVFGNDVIVSKDTHIGAKMIYFVSGTKLNTDFCKFNNLYSNVEYNNDPNSKPGYLSYRQSRVKAIKLRDIISDGFILPISSLISFYNRVEVLAENGSNKHIRFNYGKDLSEQDFKVGDTFTTINRVDICEKYIITPTRNNNQGGKAPSTSKVKLQDRLVKDQFRLHTDTAHFARNLHKFEPTDNIIITRKYHGTSGISSHVLIQHSLSFIERILIWFGINIPTTEYGYVYSSGKPKSNLPKGIFNSKQLSTYNNPNKSYYKEDYWLKAFNKLKPSLEKGITLYYEIVGDGIQGKDYTYDFEHEIFVYRITQTNIDSIAYEFSWQQVKDYCNKYGIKYVNEYWVSTYTNLDAAYSFEETNIIDCLSKTYLNKSLPDCKVDEGICIRNERTNEIFKLKSPNFILAENDIAEKEIIDIESLE